MAHFDVREICNIMSEIRDTVNGLNAHIAERPSRPLARGISPRAAHRTGREPLDLSGSCHRTKAAAFH